MLISTGIGKLGAKLVPFMPRILLFDLLLRTSTGLAESVRFVFFFFDVLFRFAVHLLLCLVARFYLLYMQMIGKMKMRANGCHVHFPNHFIHMLPTIRAT